MSWDPNASSSYDSYGNYGNYNDYGQQPQQQPSSGAPGHAPRAPTPKYGGGGGRPTTPRQQQQTVDFDAYNNYDASYSQPQQQHTSFYNHNDYGHQEYQQPPPQQHQSPHPNVGKHGPTVYNPSSSYAYGGPAMGAGPSAAASGSSFQIPGGFGEQVNPMVANMAMQYGQDIMGKGQEELKRNLDKYVSIGQLKYYFAVDNLYVGKKLGLLLFPFTQSDWSLQYAQDEPVQPKLDVNAPDLYIPCMAYVTYVLVVGYILGLRSAFSPDLLASTASSALVWLALEIGCVYLSMTLMSISTNLCKWDVLSFSTYKFVAMIVVLLAGLLTQSRQVFYVVMAYVSAALAFFLVRTLKLRIEPEVHGMPVHGKRKLYIILFYAGLQPLLIWWMTSYFAPISSPPITLAMNDALEP